MQAIDFSGISDTDQKKNNNYYSRKLTKTEANLH